MPKNKSIIDYYRARAGEYEQIYYRDVPERRKEIDDACEFVRKVATKKTVLDLACGTGYWTKVASETAKSVVAVDIAPEMIKEAKSKKYGCPVEFAVSDLYHPPFAPGSFDLIILGFWLSHEPRQNYDNLFDSILSPLRPDGHIWMIDNNPPAEGAKSDSVGLDEFGNNRKLRRLQNGDEFIIVKNYFSKEELQNLLSKRFKIESLIHQKYYWSALLQNQ